MSVTTLSKTVASCSPSRHGCTKNVSSNNQCRVVEASAMLLYIIVVFFSNVWWEGFRQNARKRSSDITYLLIQFYKGFTEYTEISVPPFRSFRRFSVKPFLQFPFKKQYSNRSGVELHVDRSMCHERLGETRGGEGKGSSVISIQKGIESEKQFGSITVWV